MSPAGGFPGPRHRTGVLWMFRVDRGTANLAEPYGAMVGQMNDSLARAGFEVDTLVVASLYDGRALWASSRELGPPPVSLPDALRHYAAHAGTEPVSACTTHSLAEVARGITGLELHYPAELVTAGASNAVGPLNPFRIAPAAFLVVLVDSASRPHEPGAPACGDFGYPPRQWFGAFETALWLYYPNQPWLRRVATHFAFVATPEQRAFDEMRAGCLKVPGFPKQALDGIEPSALKFFEPLTDGLNGYAPLARRFDFCEAVGGQWPVDAFAAEWARLLGPAVKGP